MTLPLQKTLTLSLAAAQATGICLSQAGSAGTALTINGSLASSGVATMDTARRIIITSAGNDQNCTFTIVGTDYYGRAATSTVQGANAGAAQSSKDFLTVTSVTPSIATAANVTVGTNGVASTPPHVLDTVTNPANVSIAGIVISGSATYSIEQSYDDLAPSWDFTNNPPTWFPTGVANQGVNASASLNSPANMIRLTILSGTGQVQARIIQNFRAGAF